MSQKFRERIEAEREQLLEELVGVAAEGWRQVRVLMADGAFRPFELAKVAGIATTNAARLSLAMPPAPAEEGDAPLTEAEIERARSMLVSPMR